MTKIQAGDLLQVSIEKIIVGGNGLARYQKDNQSLVVFVPFSAPGDQLKVKVSKVEKNFLEAEIVEILTPGNSRISPPCEYYSACGGCNLQHLDYPTQLIQKTNLVKETLFKFLKIDNLPFLQTIPSPKEFNYRNRIQLKCENNQVGYNQRRTHNIIPIDRCLIAEDSINDHIPKLKAENLSGKIEIYLDSKDRLSTENNQVLHRPIDENVEGLLFSQVNRFQNSNLVSTVVDWFDDLFKNLMPFTLDNQSKTKEPKQLTVFDLYSGSGNFTFPIAQKYPSAQIIGVELSRHLVNEAQTINLRSQLSNLSFFSIDVGKYLENMVIDSHNFILLDPPRTGCEKKVIEILGQKKRSGIIYISCHPVTLARDLQLLNAVSLQWNLKMTIQKIQCFDMFPQTDHIETLVLLSIK